MDAKEQSHWWWFDSHNSSNCSPWLESTLSELNEKTKAMLKLVEDDADSFAQRAEMYYKKRPELISMVEDFYRAHRSLAERYDQLKADRSVRVRSPLRHSVSLPKDEYENVFVSINSVKSFDSFGEVAYSSDEAAESEIDDPELDDDYRVDQVEGEKEKPFSAWAGSDELTKLREELDRLQEENEIQRNQIRDNNQEKEKLVIQLGDNISELKKLREEFEAVDENSLVPVKQTVRAPIEEVKTLICDAESLKLYDMYQKEQVEEEEEEEDEVMMQFEDERKFLTTKVFDEMQSLKVESMKQRELMNQKDGERIELEKKFEEAKQELLEILADNRYLQDALTLKEILLKHAEEEKTKVTRLFEEVKIELEKLIEEAQIKNTYTKMKDEQLRSAEEQKIEAKRQLEKMSDELMKLKEETQWKDRSLIETLAQKDEEKRAVIRQLTLAMEILREDNQILKKSIVKNSHKQRSPAMFQIFKGAQFSKLFNSSSRGHA